MAKNLINPNTTAAPTFYIPTENEWYKAAYYSPVKGGVGSPGYYRFATQSDKDPGNTIGSERNQANHRKNFDLYSVTQSSSRSSSQNYLTDVGSFSGSPSFYGTFDQSGNLREWNDLDGTPGPSRGRRGGNWDNHQHNLSSSSRDDSVPSYNNWSVSFRLASTIAVPTDSHLLFQPVPLTGNYNGSLNNKYTSPPTGSVLLGGVPFSIPSDGPNYWDAAAVTQGPEPVSVEIPVNVFAVRNVDTLINTLWGVAGPTSLAAIEFSGDGGAFFRVDLVGNNHIRDYANNSFPNDINGVTTRQVHADKDPIANWDTRIDKQRFELPAAFSEEVLVSVRVFDNGDFRRQRLMLSGLTVSAEASTLIEVDSGSATQSTLGYEVLTGSNAFRKAGAGELVMDRPNSLSGITRVERGGLILADALALHYSRIKVLDGASISVADSVVTSVAELTLLPAAVLNLGSGSLTVMRGFTGDQAKAELLKGRGDGFWTGTSGITSTAAAADLQNRIVRSVGWKANPDGSITVAYAAPGDTNLDGEVNVFDLVNVNGSGTYGKGDASNWSQGDFDYNGVTNIFDMVQTNGAGVYGRGSYLPAAPPSVNAVPEPASWLLAFTGLASGYYMLRRRGA